MALSDYEMTDTGRILYNLRCILGCFRGHLRNPTPGSEDDPGGHCILCGDQFLPNRTFHKLKPLCVTCEDDPKQAEEMLVRLRAYLAASTELPSKT